MPAQNENRSTWLPAALAIALAVGPAAAADDALDRLTAQRLEAVQQSLVALKGQRHELTRTGSLREYRANLHVHSSLSHDSRGTLDEIVAAAKAVGTQVLMFTEHPAEHYDFYREGHQGLRDGVLLIPGAEMKGLLAFPRQSVRSYESAAVQEFSDTVRGRDGLTFLSHLEERMDWELRGLTGVEIYNTHADFKDEKRLAAALRNPLWLVQAGDLFRKYPQAAFSALHDYPADYLRRWDQLCERAPHTGIAANDAHQNVGLTIRLAEGNQVHVDDALGKKLLELPATVVAALVAPPKDAKVGEVLFQLRLDPYECSLRHVGTHLLMPELSTEAAWQALNSGRAFVAFDWMADSTGFDLAALAAGKRYELGSRLPLADDLRLSGRAPLTGQWKLLRNGKVLAEASGREYEVRLVEPGNYRIELWLEIAGQPQIWILSNPFYVDPQDARPQGPQQ